MPETSRYEVQHESGVLEILSELPLFEEALPDYAELKESYALDFWARPTLEWDFACETLPVTRD